MFDPATIEAVIFDMDGLLIDTETIYRDASLVTATELGFDMPESVYLELIGVPADHNAAILRRGMGEAFPMEEFDRRARERFAAKVEQGIPLKPGAVELLSVLRGRGMPVAVATSTARDNAMKYLQATELWSQIDELIARDDVVNGKPNPEPFLTAAKRLNVAPSRSLGLEDSHNGVRSAAAAGLQVIMIPDLLPATDEMRKLVRGVATSLHEVRDIFAGS